MERPRIQLVLLPGMDGTGRFFAPLIGVLPPDVLPKVISYPTDNPLTYAQAERLVWDALPSQGEFALLGESYSGPIALRIAAQRPAGLRAVVLAVSFAQAPKTKAARITSKLGTLALGIPPPDWIVRRFFLGPGAPSDLVAGFKQVVGAVRPEILATRLRDILEVDVRQELKSGPYPLLCIAASNDRLVPQRIYRAMAELRPDMELVTIEGPHCLLQRNPSVAAERISEFLRRVI